MISELAKRVMPTLDAVNTTSTPSAPGRSSTDSAARRADSRLSGSSSEEFIAPSAYRGPRLRRGPSSGATQRDRRDDRSLAHSNRDVAKARRCGAVTDPHGLAGLALPAVGGSVDTPLGLPRNRVARAPEDGGNAGVSGILEHASELAVSDLPRDFASK